MRVIEKRRLKMSDKYIIIVLILTFILLFIGSITLGRYHIPIYDLINIFYIKIFNLQDTFPKAVDLVIFKVRLPRIIAAVVIGGVLSFAGSTFQGIFKNELAAPDILGASAGAGFGAALGIYMKLNFFEIEIEAFIFGMIAVGIVYAISNMSGRKGDFTLKLILSGMVISQFFSALISLVQYMADPTNNVQQAIVFWLMGGLSTLSMDSMLISFIPITIGMVVILLLRYKLNVISFGDEEAQALGVNSKLFTFIFVICTTLITAAAVSVGGIIGWVGLIIPNVTRIIFGADFRKILPVSTVMGGMFLLIVDDIARTAFANDIPIGIFTAIIGGPIFALVLIKERGKIV